MTYLLPPWLYTVGTRNDPNQGALRERAAGGSAHGLGIKRTRTCL